jgi:P27 family predicted phage terminase small subunit
MTERAPSHLGRGGRRLWRAIVRAYELEPHHLAILRAAAEAQDRMDAARAEIERDGLTIAGRYGPRAHPAVAIERDSRQALYRGLRELGLDLGAETRPPSAFQARRSR